MIPEGTYRAKVSSQPEWSYTKNGGETIALMLCIVDGEYKGSHLRWNGYFSPKVEARTLESLRYMGWTGNDIMDMILDQDVDIVIEHETYNNKTYAKIRWINNPNAIKAANPMSDDQRRMFAAKMQAKAGMTTAPVGEAAPAVTGDDVSW